MFINDVIENNKLNYDKQMEKMNIDPNKFYSLDDKSSIMQRMNTYGYVPDTEKAFDLYDLTKYKLSILCNNDQQIRETTKKTYKGYIERMKQRNILINNDVELAINKLINDKNMNENTVALHLNSLSWFKREELKTKDVKEIKISEIIILQRLRKIINEKKKRIEMNNMKNKYTTSQEKNKMTWKEIEEVYKIISVKQKTKIEKRDYVLLSLYIKQAPRRNDFWNMYIDNDYIIPNDEKEIIWHNDRNKDIGYKKIETKEEKNYYVSKENTAYLIYNNYKTVDTYGRQIIEISKELKEIIDEYIKYMGLLNGSKLLNLNNSGTKKRLIDLFKRYAKKSISVSMLRHIYITEKYNKGELKITNDRYILSQRMAHNMTTQLNYYKED